MYFQYTFHALASTAALFFCFFDPQPPLLPSKRHESLLFLNNSHCCHSMIQWNPHFLNYLGEEKLVFKISCKRFAKEQTIALNS